MFFIAVRGVYEGGAGLTRCCCGSFTFIGLVLFLFFHLDRSHWSVGVTRKQLLKCRRVSLIWSSFFFLFPSFSFPSIAFQFFFGFNCLIVLEVLRILSPLRLSVRIPKVTKHRVSRHVTTPSFQNLLALFWLFFSPGRIVSFYLSFPLNGLPHPVTITCVLIHTIWPDEKCGTICSRHDSRTYSYMNLLSSLFNTQWACVSTVRFPPTRCFVVLSGSHTQRNTQKHWYTIPVTSIVFACYCKTSLFLSLLARTLFPCNLHSISMPQL